MPRHRQLGLKLVIAFKRTFLELFRWPWKSCYRQDFNHLGQEKQGATVLKIVVHTPEKEGSSPLIPTDCGFWTTLDFSRMYTQSMVFWNSGHCFALPVTVCLCTVSLELLP
jgi:hypothetical protein